MHQQIFVNLPVKDLSRSKAFFSHLGYSFNPQFTDDKAACLILGENSYAMLLVREMFATFTNRPVCDAHECTEMLVALSCNSREHVDELVAKALAQGATPSGEPQDHGFMYDHGFYDLDGHGWGVFYMTQETPSA